MKRLTAILISVFILMAVLSVLSEMSAHTEDSTTTTTEEMPMVPTSKTSATVPTTSVTDDRTVTETTTHITDKSDVNTAPSAAVTMHISDAGLALIKKFEGYSQFPYWDYAQWTIGYGSYVCGEGEDPYKVYPNGITEAEASKKLSATVTKYEDAVNKFALEYNVILTQNQFDALVSFTYNVGANVWARDPANFSIKALLISGDYTAEEMFDAFGLWCKAGGKVNSGLVKRRAQEASLFNFDITVA